MKTGGAGDVGVPMTKHQAAIQARMRRTGESYMTARARYLAEMGMPVDPPSTKKARHRERDEADAAIFLEYGADVLGVQPSPTVAHWIHRRTQS